MRKNTLVALAALATLAAAPPSYADDTAGNAATQDEGKPGNEPVSDGAGGKTALLDDQEFVQKAIQGSMAEVQLADLALEKAKNDSVKNFAEQMKKDHTASESILRNSATQEGVQPPASLDAKHEAVKTKLAQYSGEDFDREYMAHMVADHEKELQMFSAKARTGDGDVAAYAQRMVPVLDRQLNMAKSVSQGITTKQELQEQRQGLAPRPAYGPAE